MLLMTLPTPETMDPEVFLRFDAACDDYEFWLSVDDYLRFGCS
jgi:hypothetical protein